MVDLPMQEGSLNVHKHGRFYVLGNLETAEVMLVALHGYGQLARFFGRHFLPIPSNVALVFPEGMHRFYLNGSSGRVGASWMTKEGREWDIKDNEDFMDRLVEQVQLKRFKRRILVGFSQGGATAARYFFNHSTDFSELVLWGCVFPPDIDPSFIWTTKGNCRFFIGKEDPFFQDEEKENALSFYKNQGFEIIEYTGGHAVDSLTLWQSLGLNAI
jgi:predicted esterase